MKQINCSGCQTKPVEVPDDFEFEHCCDGHMCGCQAREINPVFCDECETKIFGPKDQRRRHESTSN